MIYNIKFLIMIISLLFNLHHAQAADCFSIYQSYAEAGTALTKFDSTDLFQFGFWSLGGVATAGMCATWKGYRCSRGYYYNYYYRQPYNLLAECKVGGGSVLDKFSIDLLDKLQAPRGDTAWAIRFKTALRNFILPRSASGIYCSGTDLYTYDQIFNDAVNNFVIPDELKMIEGLVNPEEWVPVEAPPHYDR